MKIDFAITMLYLGIAIASDLLDYVPTWQSVIVNVIAILVTIDYIKRY